MFFKFKYLFIVFMFFSCSQKTLYYWGKYPHTLYDYTKKLDIDSFDRHKEELENMINKSNRFNIRVAPGINAELGYMYLNSGDKKTAVQFFQKEVILYPESGSFLNQYIDKLLGE